MTTDREFTASMSLPDLPGESVVSRMNLPADNDQATAVCVDRLRRAAIDDAQHPVVIRATAAAIAGVDGPAAGSLARARAIWEWVRSHVELKEDAGALLALLGLEDETDFFIRPARLLTMVRPQEDCDGFSGLSCAMLLAAGMRCEFVTIAYDDRDRRRWSHIYAAALLEDGSRYPMDVSHGDYPGWEPPAFYRKKVWPVMTPSRRHRLNGYGYSRRGVGEIDWGSIINTAVSGGVQIAKQITLPTGSYVQRPGEVMSATGYPPTSTLGLNQAGGISTNTLLVGGGLLVLALFAFGGRR